MGHLVDGSDGRGWHILLSTVQLWCHTLKLQFTSWGPVEHFPSCRRMSTLNSFRSAMVNVWIMMKGKGNTRQESTSGSLNLPKLIGIKGKIFAKKRYSEKVQLKRTIKAHEEKKTKQKDEGTTSDGALPAYLLDRESTSQAKLLSSMVKQKRKA